MTEMLYTRARLHTHTTVTLEAIFMKTDKPGISSQEINYTTDFGESYAH